MSSLEEFSSEPGSFRDRTSRVFYQTNAVLRALTAPALADWQQLTTTGFFHRLHKAGKIVQTLLRHTDDHYTDYELGYFEQCVAAAFTIRERQPLASGTRILDHGQPKT